MIFSSQPLQITPGLIYSKQFETEYFECEQLNKLCSVPLQIISVTLYTKLKKLSIEQLIVGSAPLKINSETL